MKKIHTLFLCCFLFLISFAYAATGLLFNVSESGSSAAVDIILCLNGKGPTSCQKYHVSAQNLSISTTINHTYPIAGIKILTPGYSPSGCTPYPNGYCLFQTSSTGAANLVLNSGSQNSAPGAPTNVVAAIGNASSLVTWTAPVGASVTSYTATASNGNTCTVAAPTTQCRVTGLTNGDSYTFTVTATNAVGTSVPSVSSNAVIPASFKLLAKFNTNTGYNSGTIANSSWGALVQGLNGDLYGVAPEGGLNNVGTFFKLSLVDGTLTALASFDSSTTGANPFGRVVQTSDGNFYGTTTLGGTNNAGTIYKFSADGVLSPLASFDTFVGLSPIGGLLQTSDDDFYGSTSAGGQNNFGTIFKFSRSSNSLSLVVYADTANGVSPRGALIQGSDGNLYGVTVLGGTNGIGSIFNVSLPSSTSLLASCELSTAAYPLAGLIQAADGNLYGATFGGGANSIGAVYKVSPSGGTIDVVNSFDVINTGGLSYAPLIQLPDGLLYGTTFAGGAFGGGTVFAIDPISGAFTIVASLDTATTGSGPQGGLLLGSDGNLYGMTTQGPSGSLGTIFVLYPPFT